MVYLRAKNRHLRKERNRRKMKRNCGSANFIVTESYKETVRLN